MVPRIRHALNGLPSQDVVSVNGEHVGVTSSPLRRADGRALVGVTIAGVRLDSVVHRLEQAGRSKDRLVASESHELGTPLTGILGFVEARCVLDHLDGRIGQVVGGGHRRRHRRTASGRRFIRNLVTNTHRFDHKA